jgi:hypothetical protein
MNGPSSHFTDTFVNDGYGVVHLCATNFVQTVSLTQKKAYCLSLL